jgi:peptidyl-dipeptidase Dcp
MKVHERRKTVSIAVLALAVALGPSCGGKTRTVSEPQPVEEPQPAEEPENPLVAEFDTPFGVPPFDRIELEHFAPAYRRAIREHEEEIAAIVDNPDPPTFENTVVAFDSSGLLLERVEAVFHNLNASTTSDEMQAVAKEMAPLLAKHEDDVYLDAELFERIARVHVRRDELELDEEQRRLVEEIHKDFVRGGANLSEEDKERFREINEELSVITLQFAENVLAETKRFRMVVEDEADLAGLPDAQVAAAAALAEEEGLDGWAFTIDKSCLIPFLTFSERRELRERMFTAYVEQGDHGDDLDNNDLVERIVALRIERAHMLGFETHADFVLDVNMAKMPEAVYDLLDQLWEPALEVAGEEAEQLEALMKKDGVDGDLEPWDWWYYAEKLRAKRYDLDEEQLRPYFELENVRKGAFDVASRLYGIQLVENDEIPTYHEDVRAFEVREADGTHIGVFYVDYYTRTGTKKGGAWSSAYRKQWDDVTPVIANNCNFQRPTGDEPTLLSLDEVQTLFHEFGHALHGLLSDSRYHTLSGTSVARDFVELPSQIMENWARHPEVLKLYAQHHETGEPMPDELAAKIDETAHFNQGFVTVEYLAAAYLDMDWHTLEEMPDVAPATFEERSMDEIGLIDEIVVRYRSTYFRHVFSNVIGYSAGYYSYVWSQVLDADAFAAFEETDVFDQERAKAFREHVLAAGNTADPMVLYKRFRGQEPTIDALLERKGFE